VKPLSISFDESISIRRLALIRVCLDKDVEQSRLLKKARKVVWGNVFLSFALSFSSLNNDLISWKLHERSVQE